MINLMFLLSNLPSYLTFNRNCRNFMREQEEYLMQCLRDNDSTDFGRKHGFREITSVAEYQERIPLTEYGDYEPYIERLKRSGGKVLTEERIIMLELSSGSTSASKYIPYTAGLKGDFMMGVRPWLFDLFLHHRSLLWGKSYWSISPIDQTGQRTASGIPIGFEDDTGYFGAVQSFILSRMFVVPGEIKQIGDIEDFRYVTLLFLVSEKKLTLISIWNPTFLTLLLDFFLDNHDRILRDIREGEIRPVNGSRIPESLLRRSRKNTARAMELDSIINAYGLSNDRCTEDSRRRGIFSRVWPRLKVISCWDQGNSKAAAEMLRQYFGDILIQGKGLLATEGMVTFPLSGIGHVVSYRSHFF